MKMAALIVATLLLPVVIGLGAAYARHRLERYEARPVGKDVVSRMRERSLL